MEQNYDSINVYTYMISHGQPVVNQQAIPTVPFFSFPFKHETGGQPSQLHPFLPRPPLTSHL